LAAQDVELTEEIIPLRATEPNVLAAFRPELPSTRRKVMVGQKTRDQQQRVIKGQENTKGGGNDFPAEDDLSASKELRDAKLKGNTINTPVSDLSDPDDRSIVRGRNQESRGKR
jgi:hypothetical protein